MNGSSEELALSKIFDPIQQEKLALNEQKSLILISQKRKLKTNLFLLFITFSVALIFIIFLLNLFPFQYSVQNHQLIQEPLDKLDKIEIMEEQNIEDKQKRRNLSVWTSNCCPTTQSCGIIFEDCCEIDARGCNWYIFCYKIAADNNCNRVAIIVQSTNGYWAF